MLYSLSIFLYTAAIRIASAWNEKARAWVNGRKQWQQGIRTIRDKAGTREILWVHCASLGEFEQGRPVIESIRKQFPHAFIVLSFFSPSGYEIRKGYDKADAVIYLPADTPSNAKAFVSLLQPKLAIFIKYEYWLNILRELHAAGIPVLMVSAIFRKDQVFFKWYGMAWKRILNTIHHFFVQDNNSGRLLDTLGVDRYTVAGDTRFDRVLQIASQFTAIPEVESFCGGAAILVAGSTWREDEMMIGRYLSATPALKCVIAPHEIHEAHLQQMEQALPDSVRFSEWKKDPSGNHRVLIIDNIGMLSRLYHYGDITYVGGGYGNGIHNTLEAAVHGKPVIFGPRYQKFKEAVELIECGGAFTIENDTAFITAMHTLLQDNIKRENSGRAAGNYVRTSAGATEKIMNYIQENRLLTS